MTQWKVIPEFPDYSVSNEGHVRNNRNGRRIRGIRHQRGHLMVTLSKDARQYKRYIHLLVAEAFLEDYNPSNGQQLRHIDDNHSNNHVDNLEFRGDYPEYRYIKPKSERAGRRVRVVETGLVYRNAMVCAEHIGGSMRLIYRVIQGRRKTHKGYTFEFLTTQEALEYARKGKIIS